MTAYDLTLQALDMFDRMERPRLCGRGNCLTRRSRSIPNTRPAYSRMASLRMRWIGQGWSEDEMSTARWRQARHAMAIEQDRNDALGLAIYGHLQSYLLKDYNVAQELP